MIFYEVTAGSKYATGGRITIGYFTTKEQAAAKIKKIKKNKDTGYHMFETWKRHMEGDETVNDKGIHKSSWDGQVDRMSGAFDDSEILKHYREQW